jgi:hypothetical protein
MLMINRTDEDTGKYRVIVYTYIYVYMDSEAFSDGQGVEAICLI